MGGLNAKQIIGEDWREIKECIEIVNGLLVRVWDENGKLIYGTPPEADKTIEEIYALLSAAKKNNEARKNGWAKRISDKGIA